MKKINYLMKLLLNINLNLFNLFPPLLLFVFSLYFCSLFTYIRLIKHFDKYVEIVNCMNYKDYTKQTTFDNVYF